MPHIERNSWDRANQQGENLTDYNREKTDEEYQQVREEPTDGESPAADVQKGNINDVAGDATICASNTPNILDFLCYGTSDDDMQF